MTYVMFEKGVRPEGSHHEEVKTKALPQSKTEPREYGRSVSKDDGPHGAGKKDNGRNVSEDEDDKRRENEDDRSEDVNEDEDNEDDEILAAMVAEMEEYVGGAPPVG